MKTYLNPSVSRERAERVQMKIDLDMLTASCTNECAAVVLPSSVSSDVAAAVRVMCNRARAVRLYGKDMKRAAFMADRQKAGTVAREDDAPAVYMPFVAYFVPADEAAARAALPAGQRKAFEYSRRDEVPFMLSVRKVDMYAAWGQATKTANTIAPDGMTLEMVYLDVYAADGRADGDALTAAGKHVAKRTIKNALDTAGRYTADGRYTVQAYMYADICRPEPTRADVQDLTSAAVMGMLEAIAARAALRDVYAAGYAAANRQIDGERKTAANTIYMDATAGDDESPLSGQLVSVKGTMRAIIAGDNAHISDFDAPPSVSAGKRAALDWIMSQLTPTQKENISRRAAGDSFRQIAAARGCTVRAVAKSVDLARAKAAAAYPDIAGEYAAADCRAEYGAHIAAAPDVPETVMHDGMYAHDEHMTAAAAFAAVGAEKARAALTAAAVRYDRRRRAADTLPDIAAARAAHRAAFIEFEIVRARAARAIETAVHTADTADLYAGFAARAARADEAARRLTEKAAHAARMMEKANARDLKNAATRAARLATAAKNAAARADEARRAADEAAAARDVERAAHAAQIAAQNVAGYAAAAAANAKRKAARNAAAARMPRVVYGKGRLCMSDVLYIRHGVQTRKGRAPRVMYTRFDTLETVSAFELAARQTAAYKAAKNAARR